MLLELSTRHAEILLAFLEDEERKLHGDDEIELEDLTERENEILILLASGLTNIEIAAHCTIALSTVKTHINNIKTKFGVSTTRKATALAFKLRIVTTEQII